MRPRPHYRRSDEWTFAPGQSQSRARATRAGRSPGSRIIARRAPSQTISSSEIAPVAAVRSRTARASYSPLTVAGTAADQNPNKARTVFPLPAQILDGGRFRLQRLVIRHQHNTSLQRRKSRSRRRNARMKFVRSNRQSLQMIASMVDRGRRPTRAGRTRKTSEEQHVFRIRLGHFEFGDRRSADQSKPIGHLAMDVALYFHGILQIQLIE
jgi:hypothetical protein